MNDISKILKIVCMYTFPCTTDEWLALGQAYFSTPAKCWKENNIFWVGYMHCSCIWSSGNPLHFMFLKKEKKKYRFLVDFYNAEAWGQVFTTFLRMTLIKRNTQLEQCTYLNLHGMRRLTGYNSLDTTLRTNALNEIIFQAKRIELISPKMYVRSLRELGAFWRPMDTFAQSSTHFAMLHWTQN